MARRIWIEENWTTSCQRFRVSRNVFKELLKQKKISCIIENCWIYYLLLTCLLFYPGNISISLCIISGQRQVYWIYLRPGTCSRKLWSRCMSGSRHHLSTMASPWTATLSFRVICMSILLLEVWWNFQLTFWPHISAARNKVNTCKYIGFVSSVNWPPHKLTTFWFRPKGDRLVRFTAYLQFG